MKESLKLLGVTTSGLENFGTSGKPPKHDDEIIKEAEEINNPGEKEAYLRKILEQKKAGYLKTKRYLIELIKKSDPQYACDLIISVCQSSPVDPNNYLLFAEIAFSNSAWQVAKNTLDVIAWLSKEADLEVIRKKESLLLTILDKIKKKEKDNSNDSFWYNKSPDKYWILERLYFQSKKKELADYSFELLKKHPDDKNNYEIAFKALTLLNTKEIINRYIQFIKSNLLDDNVNQNLFLGMAYYSLLDFDTSIKHLQESLKLEKTNPKALFYLSLCHLNKNNHKDFILYSQLIISAIEPSYIALYFVSSALSNFQLDKIEFPNQKIISREISVILDNLLKSNQQNTVELITGQFKKLDYYLILPYLKLYLCEMYIKNNDLLRAKEILSGCNDIEVFRLSAWIHRLEGKDDLAEGELIKYRQSWIPDKEVGLHCKLVDLELPDKAPDDLEDIFKLFKNAFDKTKEIIRQIDLEYGLNTMTCVETACQDCCKKTFPYISYTEYLYMKKWLDKQNDEYKNHIYQQSVEIVENYRKKYKKDPPFMCGESIDQQKEYPSDFVFNCPYLGENKCNIYEARPFTCRAYSYASQDGIRYKGCNYFFEQLKGATKLHDIRKVIDMESFFNFAKLTDEKLIGKRIIAPIPVWFAQSHEDVVSRLLFVVRDSDKE